MSHINMEKKKKNWEEGQRPNGKKDDTKTHGNIALYACHNEVGYTYIYTKMNKKEYKIQLPQNGEKGTTQNKKCYTHDIYICCC